jgi:hypothetical protein
MTGPQYLIEQSINDRPVIVMLDRTIKEARLIDVAIPYIHNLTATSSRISRPTRRAKKNVETLGLSTMGIIPKNYTTVSTAESSPGYIFLYRKQ